MRIPVHPPWLPGYIDVMQTVLITLTMAGLFLDRPHILLPSNPICMGVALYSSLLTAHAGHTQGYI